MWRIWRLIVAMVVAPMGIGPWAWSAAQEATPIASPAAIPIELPAAPDPAWCQGQPRDLIAFAESLPAEPTAMATPRPTAIRSAPTEVVEALTQTLIEQAACLNARDFARSLSLFTDRALAEALWLDASASGVLPLTLAAYLQGVEPNPLPRSRWVVVVAIDEAEQLADGRVRVMITTESVDRDPPRQTRRGYFALVDGRWLFDGQGA